MENSKNFAIREIQNELKKIREAHSNMVKTYEGKLSEFGIPVEELGFDPLVPANIWAASLLACVCVNLNVCVGSKTLRKKGWFFYFSFNLFPQTLFKF